MTANFGRDDTGARMATDSGARPASPARDRRREVTAACREIAATAMAVGLRAWDLDRLSGEEMPSPCGVAVGRLCEAAETLLDAFDRLDAALTPPPCAGGRDSDGDA